MKKDGCSYCHGQHYGGGDGRHFKGNYGDGDCEVGLKVQLYTGIYQINEK